MRQSKSHEEEVKEKSKEVVSASLIIRKKQAVVVQITESGIIRRVVVPSSVIIDDDGITAYLLKDDFDLGIEYGVPFRDLMHDHTIATSDVENALHANNLWTAEDIIKNPSSVQSAILSASRAIMADVVQIAKSYSRKEN